MVERRQEAMMSPVALVQLQGPALTIEWANPRFYEMAAMFSDDEFLGHSVNEYLPEMHSPTIERALNNAWDTGEPASLEGEVVGPGGVMSFAATAYRLPGDRLLVAMWHPSSEPIAEIDGTIGQMRMGEEAPDRRSVTGEAPREA
jgi:PAS fold